MLGSSAISIIILSTPKAAPACGGVPYWNALYNAPNTINHYYTAEVNHDMYGFDPTESF